MKKLTTLQDISFFPVFTKLYFTLNEAALLSASPPTGVQAHVLCSRQELAWHRGIAEALTLKLPSLPSSAVSPYLPQAGARSQ